VSNSYNDFNRALIADLRANRGKASGGPFKGGQVLILTTKGARSGEPREHPLAYSEDGGHHVIVASKGGAPTHPHWFHNLRKHPIVTVEAGGETYQAKAKVVENAEEYERLYAQHAALMPGFNDYRKKTDRRIPVIVLEPVDEAVA
jgi:deazaflavin-dependent oxidoreductase (nitroreductase family)